MQQRMTGCLKAGSRSEMPLRGRGSFTTDSGPSHCGRIEVKNHTYLTADGLPSTSCQRTVQHGTSHISVLINSAVARSLIFAHLRPTIPPVIHFFIGMSASNKLRASPDRLSKVQLGMICGNIRFVFHPTSKDGVSRSFLTPTSSTAVTCHILAPVHAFFMH